MLKTKILLKVATNETTTLHWTIMNMYFNIAWNLWFRIQN